MIFFFFFSLQFLSYKFHKPVGIINRTKILKEVKTKEVESHMNACSLDLLRKRVQWFRVRLCNDESQKVLYHYHKSRLTSYTEMS